MSGEAITRGPYIRAPSHIGANGVCGCPSVTAVSILSGPKEMCVPNGIRMLTRSPAFQSRSGISA